VARLAQTLDPLLEQLEGGVEVELLSLEPTYDFFEPLELLGEVEGLAGTRHQESVTRAPTVPSVTRRRNGNAGVNCATRFSTRPCSSRASAYPRSRMRSGDSASRRPAKAAMDW